MFGRKSILEAAQDAFENHFTAVFVITGMVGLLLRIGATHPRVSGFIGPMLADFMKETGNFVLSILLIALLYEHFVNYKNRREFRRELNDVISGVMQLGVHKVYSRRPSLAVKAEFIRGAKFQIIELGTALNTFTSYVVSDMTTGLEGEGVSEAITYGELLKAKLREGVDIDCLVLDPDFANDKTVGEGLPEGSFKKISDSVSKLSVIVKKWGEEKSAGKMRITLYRHVPHYAAICVDGDDPHTGRMLLTPYIPGLANGAAPVFDIRRAENEKVFMAYYQGIRSLMRPLSSRSSGQADGAASSAA
jgi:hypothetical protein